MKATLVKGPKSALFGAKCGLCPHKVTTGESVLFKHMANDSYRETRLVFHADCMRALVDRAPVGIPAGDHRAAGARIGAVIAATGNPFAAVA